MTVPEITLPSEPWKRTSKFAPEECPWETGEIEQCPAFLEPKYSKDFQCPHVRECTEEIVEIITDAQGVI